MVDLSSIQIFNHLNGGLVQYSDRAYIFQILESNDGTIKKSSRLSPSKTAKPKEGILNQKPS